MLFRNASDIDRCIEGVIVIDSDEVVIRDPDQVRKDRIDRLLYNALFHPSDEIRYFMHWLIRELAAGEGIYPASLLGLHRRLAARDGVRLTIPIFGTRLLPYETARAALRAAQEKSTDIVVFERPVDSAEAAEGGLYLDMASAVLAAAIKEGMQGPVFLRGSFAVDRERYRANGDAERDRLKNRIQDAVEAGFFNIAIDASPLVDYTQPTWLEQQRENVELSGELAAFVREVEPAAIRSSLGATFAEVCDVEQNVHELRAFLDGFQVALANRNGQAEGLATAIIKSGMEQPPPTDARSDLIVEGTLREVAQVCHREYGVALSLAGGIESLPDDSLSSLMPMGVGEVDCGDMIDDLVFDHPAFAEPRDEIAARIAGLPSAARQPGESDRHFFHRARWRVMGESRERIWGLSPQKKGALQKALQERIAILIEHLHLVNSAGLVRDAIDLRKVSLPNPAAGFDHSAESALHRIAAEIPAAELPVIPGSPEGLR